MTASRPKRSTSVSPSLWPTAGARFPPCSVTSRRSRPPTTPPARSHRSCPPPLATPFRAAAGPELSAAGEDLGQQHRLGGEGRVDVEGAGVVDGRQPLRG